LQFLIRIETQHNVTVAIIHTDNNTTLINKQTRKKLEQRGTVFKASTPYTAHQNSVAESSNRLNETRTRCIVNSAPHLPKDLWPYAARYSIDVLNHTPTTAVPDDKTPRQLVLEHMQFANLVPNLSSIRVYRELGFVHRPAQRRVKGARFDSRATGTYFVGREGSRIYLMWDPVTATVHQTSSVTWPGQDFVAKLNSRDPNTVDTKPASRPYTISLIEPTAEPPPTPTPSPVYQQPGGEAEASGREEDQEPRGAGRDNDGCDEDEAPEISSGTIFDGFNEATSFNFNADINNLTITPPTSDTELANARASPSPPQRSEAPRHLNISTSVETRNIITGHRKRRPTHKLMAIALLKPYIPVTLARCLATAIVNAPVATKREFPPEPVNGKQARRHLYCKEWALAEDEEYKSHNDNNT
jgi:hypothetical protein